MYLHIETMVDASEVIHYDEPLVPLYIRTSKLSYYENKSALCHWHDDIEFLHILKGEMYYSVNGKRVLLQEKDAIMVNVRHMHYGYAVNDHDADFICILFNPSLLMANQVLYQRFVTPLIENTTLEYLHFKASSQSDCRIIDDLNQLVTLKHLAQTTYQLDILSTLYSLWGKLYMTAALQPPQKEDTTTSDIAIQKAMVSFIHQNYHKKLTLDAIANTAHISRSKCCKIFKHYLHQSPIDFLNAYRLKISCKLLTTTEQSITDIALSCGFNHLSYYSELFQRTYGCTPRAFRHQVLTKD